MRLTCNPSRRVGMKGAVSHDRCPHIPERDITSRIKQQDSSPADATTIQHKLTAGVASHQLADGSIQLRAHSEVLELVSGMGAAKATTRVATVEPPRSADPPRSDPDKRNTGSPHLHASPSPPNTRSHQGEIKVATISSYSIAPSPVRRGAREPPGEPNTKITSSKIGGAGGSNQGREPPLHDPARGSSSDHEPSSIYFGDHRLPRLDQVSDGSRRIPRATRRPNKVTQLRLLGAKSPLDLSHSLIKHLRGGANEYSSRSRNSKPRPVCFR